MIKKENLTRHLNQRTLDVVILLAAILLGLYFDWTNMEIIIFVIFVGIILHPVPSRRLAIPALFFLVIVPFLLIFKKEVRAEEFAVYAYYFLIMAVIMGIYEIRKGDKKEASLKLQE